MRRPPRPKRTRLEGRLQLAERMGTAMWWTVGQLAHAHGETVNTVRDRLAELIAAGRAERRMETMAEMLERRQFRRHLAGARRQLWIYRGIPPQGGQ